MTVKQLESIVKVLKDKNITEITFIPMLSTYCDMLYVIKAENFRLVVKKDKLEITEEKITTVEY